MDNAHIESRIRVVQNDLSCGGFGFRVLTVNQIWRKTADFCNRFVRRSLRNGMNRADINNAVDSGIPGQTHHVVSAMYIDIPDLRIVL